MRRMVKSNFSKPSVWLWIHVSDVLARQFVNFVKWNMSDYKDVHFVYSSFKYECLNKAKTRVPSMIVYLLFLVKLGDDRTSHLQPNVMTKFVVLSNLSFYLDAKFFGNFLYLTFFPI